MIQLEDLLLNLTILKFAVVQNDGEPGVRQRVMVRNENLLVFRDEGLAFRNGITIKTVQIRIHPVNYIGYESGRLPVRAGVANPVA